MSHHSTKESYKKLEQRINKLPQGVAPSKTLNKILSILFSEKEANLVAQLPIKPFTIDVASKIWNMDKVIARKILDELASRAILLDIERDGEQKYVLPPPMAGFFEFALMRTRGDIDQKFLSEMFYQYLNVEEDFIKNLFVQGDTNFGRTFVHETVLTNENAIHCLDYERATNAIRQAPQIGVSMCYCRHKMQHLGKECSAPMDTCLTLGMSGSSLIKHNYARKIEVSEALEILDRCYEQNLVQFGENVRENVGFLCNCCGCCCDAMIAAREFASLQPIHTTNFIPKILENSCNGCGKCLKVCPVEAISLVAYDAIEKEIKKAKINEEICLGCGLCVRACQTKSILLESRKERVITPVNMLHRTIVMAIEKGKLQNLIFDNQVLFSHRAMAAVLSVIMKLPPIKQVMASKQFKSIYLDRLLSRKDI